MSTTIVSTDYGFAAIQDRAFRFPAEGIADAIWTMCLLIEDGEQTGPKNVWAFYVEYLMAAYETLGADMSAAPAIVAAPVEPVPTVSNGFYSVVLTGADDYVTLKISDDFRQGSSGKMAAFLIGPSNEADYMGFAFVEGANVKMWGRFKTGYERQRAALAVLLGANDRGEYTQAYAMQSGRCAKCGRTLTVPASLARGLGPECAAKGM